MADIPFFSNEDSKRISNDVVWGEGEKNRGMSSVSHEQENFPEAIYVEIIDNDPNGKSGWSSAAERVFDNDEWTEPSNPRLWNDEEFDYIRHYKWERLPVGAIVKIKVVVNVDTGEEEWVYYNETTNPEAFVLHCLKGGNSTGGPNSTWTMRNGGSILTNIGTLDLEPTTFVFPSTYLGVEVTFVDDGYGLKLSTATYTNSESDYWVGTPDEGTIVINWPLASLERAGGKSTLTQHYAGDIHIEIFGNLSEDPYIRILGDEIWINATKAGGTDLISHIGPSPANPWNGIKGLNKEFSCDEVAFGSVQDVQNWINNVLLASIEQINYDTKGHIYELLDCSGSPTGDTSTTEDGVLSSTLTGAIITGDLMPNIVNVDSGFNITYQIFKDGGAALGFVGAKKAMITVTNDLNETILFDDGNTAIAPRTAFLNDPLQNVSGTAGFKSGDPNNADDIIALSHLRFRFNASVIIRASVIGGGLEKTLILPSAPCAVTINTESLGPNPDIIRHWDDPKAIGFGFNTQYDINDLNSIYEVRYTFKYADDTLVKFSNAGSQGVYTAGFRTLQLSANSTVDVDPRTGIFFDIDEDQEDGAVIKLCFELVTSIDGNYNANVNACEFLNFKTVSDCIIDGSGQPVSDGSDDCLTAGCDTSVLPNTFEIDINADTGGDNLGSAAFESFTVTRDSSPTLGVASWTFADAGVGGSTCGSVQCFELEFILYVECISDVLTWKIAGWDRACNYAAVSSATKTGDDPTGDYSLTVTFGGGGGTAPCVNPTNVSAGQIGTVTVTN